MSRKKTPPLRITHLYNITKLLKTVLHYELQDKHPKPVLLTEAIKLNQDPSYYKISGILYTLQWRGANKWCRNTVQLIPIGKHYYQGVINLKDKKSLAIFQLSPDKKQLVIDIFRGYYTEDEAAILEIVEGIPYYFKKKERRSTLSQ